MAKKRKTAAKATARAGIGKTKTGKAKKTASAPPVKARFTLKSLGGNVPRTPEATREVVQRIVKQAESESGSKSQDLKVYANIDSFAVSGAPALVESLQRHKEVASKLPEVTSDEVVIRPVGKRGVKLKSDRKTRSEE